MRLISVVARVPVVRFHGITGVCVGGVGVGIKKLSGEVDGTEGRVKD